jgi:hypothetical protein
MVRQNFVQMGRYRPQVVHDDNRRSEIGRQILEQALVGVLSACRTAYANNRHVLRNHRVIIFLGIAWISGLRN